MKNFALILGLVLAASFSHAQSGQFQVPNVKVKDLKGNWINTSHFDNDGKPMIINFWATWCMPCKRELNNIAEVYPDWVDETGVKLIAISIDDARSESRVIPYVNGADWDYEVYIDSNADFKRAMNVNNVPHTFLVDASGNVVWQHNNYAPGDEDKLYKEIKALVGMR
ncbi:MAG: TlpA family protein disulfide reductase [Cryomorphaceae bacterium]|nr:MAG: TlpA family protein disulfide reductase [Cryomorphaceae bacterium]